MSNNFPTGPYTVMTQKKHSLNDIKYDKEKKCHLLKSKKMSGLVLCRVLAPKGLKEPYVQTIRLKDKAIVYGLCELCIQKSYTGSCNHSDLERSHVQTFVWPEIDFMVSSLNYKLMAVYECYQYDQESPLFSGFIKLLANGKLKHSITDLNEIPFINKKMKFPPNLALKRDEISINPVRTSFYKHMLVAFLGKLAQSTSKSKTIFVRNKNQLQSIFYKEKIVDIFTYDNICQVIIKPPKKVNQNRSANSVLYAYITALSRIYMHKCLLKLWSLGCIVYALECDNIYFSRPNTLPNPLKYSKTFGYFQDQFVDCVILAFNSFGSKSNNVSYIKNGILCQKMKARGFNLDSSLIHNILEFYSIEELLRYYVQEEIIQIKVPQLRNRRNLKTMTINQVLTEFRLSNLIVTKRVFNNDFSSKPFGFV